MLKKLICILFCFLFIGINVCAVSYPAYTYLENGEICEIPQPFSVEKVLYGEDFSLNTLVGASDVFCDLDGTVYISAANENVIAVLKPDGSSFLIEGFNCDGIYHTFNSPEGIFVLNGKLYVCDYKNNRLVIIELSDFSGMIIENIKSKILDKDFVFQPKRVAVDSFGRIYCVSDGQYNGLMTFEKNGSFVGFVGANKTTVSIIDRIWRKLSTKAQQAQQSLFIPTEFSSVAIDNENFVYTVTSTVDMYEPKKSEPVRRQSPNGDNIIKFDDEGYPIGDIKYSYDAESFKGPSRFCDVDVWDNKMYSVLDQNKNRIFTYDMNGSLLFVYGGYGESEGYFKQPEALSQMGDRLYVLDVKIGALTVLKTTEYASKLISAENYTAGDYNSALSAWSEVLEYNGNNELAYLNISRIMLDKNDAKSAMRYAEIANNKQAYSEAFSQNRTAFIGENIGNIIMVSVIAVIVLAISVRLLKKYNISNKLKQRSATYSSLSFCKNIFYAPFDGFWVQKHENKCNVLSGVIIIFLLFLSFTVSGLYTGFCFTTAKSELEQFNVLLALVKAVLPIMLWCISNWCVTALTEGSGNFKQIFISSCYAITPFIITSFIKTAFSNILTCDEGQILTIIGAVGIIYSAFLIVAAVCSVHDCSMGKALATILLTIIGMAIIVFISVLFFNLINKFFDFAVSVYNELRLRG